MPARLRYWVFRITAWREVSRPEYLAAQNAAGFESDKIDGDYDNARGDRGRVTYGKISRTRYTYEPEFLSAVDATELQ